MTHLSSSSGLLFSVINGQIHGSSQEGRICNLGLPLFSGSFTSLFCSYLVSEGGSSFLGFSWHFFFILMPLLILFSFQSDFRGTILFLFIFYSILFAYLSVSLLQFFLYHSFFSFFFFKFSSGYFHRQSPNSKPISCF